MESFNKQVSKDGELRSKFNPKWAFSIHHQTMLLRKNWNIFLWSLTPVLNWQNSSTRIWSRPIIMIPDEKAWMPSRFFGVTFWNSIVISAMRVLIFTWKTLLSFARFPVWIWDNIPANRFSKRASKASRSKHGRCFTGKSLATVFKRRSKQERRFGSTPLQSGPTFTMPWIPPWWPMAFASLPDGLRQESSCLHSPAMFSGVYARGDKKRLLVVLDDNVSNVPDGTHAYRHIEARLHARDFLWRDTVMSVSVCNWIED